MSAACIHDRRRFLRTAAMTIAAAQIGMLGCAKATPNDSLPLSVEGQMPSLEGATGWLNSQPLSASGLRGRVVLIDFWTYTCINWRRTLPYIRAWSEKYKNHGLVVIGVHSPEFTFERNADNVRWAVKAMGIEYPVAIDSDLAVWRAFDNEYWPALYFIDARGRIRHHQFGEGEYDLSETVIQRLLAEAKLSDPDHDVVSVNAHGAEVAADWRSLRSQENYVGYERTEGFASPGGAVRNKSHIYVAPAQLQLNQWALAGHLVMGPAARGTSVRFRVLINGQPPLAAHGVDVDEQGKGTVIEQRLYQLIRQSEPIVDQRFEIEFLDPGAEAFSFTFG
jgi:thiol-disulfide isomerase/thioredoxin